MTSESSYESQESNTHDTTKNERLTARLSRKLHLVTLKKLAEENMNQTNKSKKKNEMKVKQLIARRATAKKIEAEDKTKALKDWQSNKHKIIGN